MGVGVGAGAPDSPFRYRSISSSVVTITMPKQLMQDIHQGSIELEAETIDIEDIEQAYEVGLEDDVYKNQDEQNDQQQQPPIQQPIQQPPAF